MAFVARLVENDGSVGDYRFAGEPGLRLELSPLTGHGDWVRVFRIEAGFDRLTYIECAPRETPPSAP